MEPTASTEDTRIKQFWDDYLQTIRLFRIPELNFNGIIIDRNNSER